MSKVTAAKIKEWKKEHFAVYMVTGENEEVGYLKYPSWAQWKLIFSAGEKTEGEYVESFLNNCWLGGDEVIKENYGYFKKIGEQINKVFVSADVTAVKVENHYLVTIKDTNDYDGARVIEMKLKPVTREMSNMAERNADNSTFSKEENLLKLCYLDGAKEVVKEHLKDKNPYYYLPLVQQVKELYEKKMLSIKKL